MTFTEPAAASRSPSRWMLLDDFLIGASADRVDAGRAAGESLGVVQVRCSSAR